MGYCSVLPPDEVLMNRYKRSREIWDHENLPRNLFYFLSWSCSFCAASSSSLLRCQISERICYYLHGKMIFLFVNDFRSTYQLYTSLGLKPLLGVYSPSQARSLMKTWHNYTYLYRMSHRDVYRAISPVY